MDSKVLSTWHEIVRTRDVSGLAELLADDVVFYSPVVHTPQVGKGVPFRTAHDTVGHIVLSAIKQGRELHEMPLEELRRHSDRIETDVFTALAIEQTLATKGALGGTSPARVAAELRTARAKIDG